MKTVKPILVQRTRAHRVLFETGSPFRSRTVQNKTRYQRNLKHKDQRHDT